MINRALIGFTSQSLKKEQAWETGGKKDKEKNKQQQLTKQKQEGQKKHDKSPAKKPVAGTS
jgi:hypothetical protein